MTKSKMVVGGQAVIEGIMMRSKNFYAIALRRKSGNIDLKVEKCSSITNKYKILAKPFIRGIVALIESLIMGMKTLSYSADVYSLDYEDDSKKDKEKNIENNITENEGSNIETEKKVEEKKNISMEIIFSIILSFGFGILLFVMAPLWLTNLIKIKMDMTSFGFNMIDGIIRLVIFLGYVVIISLMKDIRRVFEYHGAEHKTVFLYENGEKLSPENAEKYSTLHPRCGTNFMFIVIMVSILIISIFKTDTFIMKILVRLILLPVIAGFSYEILRFLGNNFHNKFFKLFFYPGLFLQKLTTREPDKSQLEIAIAALNAVLEKEDELNKND